MNNEEYFNDYYTDVEISYKASVAHPKAAILNRQGITLTRQTMSNWMLTASKLYLIPV